MSGKSISLTVSLVGLLFLGSGWGSPVQGHGEPAIRNLIESVRVEKPVRYRNLTIFPLAFHRIRDRACYLTLDEAVGKGVLRISELDGGRVNEVEVENTSRHYVFLMAGELLTGCKQDRMVSDDCLLPPRSGRVRLSVYCTEHGRWTSKGRSFKSQGESVHIYMRQLAKATRSQDRVWAEVEDKREELGVSPSATEAFKKVVEDQSVQRDIKPYLDELGRIPRLSRDICGVVAAVGGRILVCDVFSSHQLFEKLWPKLLRSYALDVVGSSSHGGSVSNWNVENFLRNALSAEYERGETDGVGRVVEIQSRPVFGSALIYKGNVIHMDLFPRRSIPVRGSPMNLDMRRQRREDQ